MGTSVGAEAGTVAVGGGVEVVSGTDVGVRSPPHDRAARSINAASTRNAPVGEEWGNRVVGVVRLFTLTPTLSLKGEGEVGGGLESRRACPG